LCFVLFRFSLLEDVIGCILNNLLPFVANLFICDLWQALLESFHEQVLLCPLGDTQGTLDDIVAERISHQT
jgi:hypothetical protein